MRLIALVAALTLVSSPVLAAREVLTPSGQPDAVFEATSLADAHSKISNACMNRGWQVASQTTNQVVCEIPVGTVKAAFQQLLVGNSYSTTPRTFVRFSIAQVGPHARAQAAAWVETQMAFGQLRQQPYVDDTTQNNLQGFLIQAGGELPPGSRIPGIYLGIGGSEEIEGKKVSIPVTIVFEGSPGSEAGLRVGDLLTAVNGKSLKSMEDLRKQLNKIPAGVNYPLEIVRNGTPKKVMVLARERPVVGTPEWVAMRSVERRAEGLPDVAPGPKVGEPGPG